VPYRFEHPAHVNEAGRLMMGDTTALNSWLHEQSGKALVITFETEKEKAKARFYRYYRGVLVPFLSRKLAALRGREVPYDNLSIHRLFCATFLPHEDTPLGPAPGGTKGMSTEELNSYVMRIKSHFATEYGWACPELGDEEE
jgi:hypothetical protein